MELTSPDDLYRRAQALYTAGCYREAIPYLNRIRTNELYGIRANSNIGSCLLMMGYIRPAQRYIDRALRQDPTYIPALLNRAKAFEAQQQHAEVQEVCQDILDRNPDEEEAWMHWVMSLSVTHEDASALQQVKRWQSQLPNSFLAHLLEGELLFGQGSYNEAIAAYGEALRINPNAEKAYFDLSVVMLKLEHHAASLKYLDKAISLNPEAISYWSRKAQILWLMARSNEASDWFGKAYSMQPESATLFLNQHLLLPSIPGSGEEIDLARKRFVQGLELAENTTSLKLDFLDVAIPHTFTLAYHNRDDRALIERYISLMRNLAEPLLSKHSDLDHPLRHKKAGGHSGRLRIGFLSQFFSWHSNTIAFEGLIRYLDRQLFEVVIIHSAKSKRDDFRDSLDALCDQAIQLSTDYGESFDTLHSLSLDIIFFTDIGMSSYEFILPFIGSAPIQMTGWGVPQTSGIREIDYYVSAAELEPEGAEDSYTETLVRLPGGLPCFFPTTGMHFCPLPRDYFLLPSNDTLVGCLQSLHKLHPDFDNILERIAQQNPEVAFIFVEDRIEARTSAFLERLSRTAPSVHQKCLMLAHMSRGEYHSLCHCIDLLLDPIYFGSGITFFEASFVGTPIISLEGEYLRSRVVACGYREMGIDDMPIASTIEDYVELATQLVTDPERRNRMRESILSHNHRIFNRMDYIRNFEQFCLNAASNSIF